MTQFFEVIERCSAEPIMKISRYSAIRCWSDNSCGLTILILVIAVMNNFSGGSIGSSVGQGGWSGVSAYRSDIITMGGGSHNPNIAVFGSSDGWAVLYYKTP